MKINIAGAGSGKTTKMAEKIIDRYERLPAHENIYCITFTNNAVESIETKLIDYFGNIPDNIRLSTIHSFLYQEVIKPYYYILYNKQYTQISSIQLSPEPKYKRSKITQLEEANILHVSVFSERAKWVIHKKSSDRKKEKEVRALILEKFKKYCTHIFVDEAQDIDKHLVEILKKIDEISIEIELIGDPKQDLNGTNSLRMLLEEYEENVEYITICHRSPQNHLDISNSLFPKDEWQHSEKEYGTISVLFETDINILIFFNSTAFDLKYISEKNDRYSTAQNTDIDIRFRTLFHEITDMLNQSLDEIDELRIKQIAYYLARKLISKYEQTNNEREAMKIINKYIGYDKKTYAKVINALKINTNVDVKRIPLSSIDSIKGQEGDNCLFVLTTDLAPFLFLEKTINNKTKNRLYVALTRSLDKLTILVTKEVEEKYSKEFIKDFLKKYTL
ncbi:AAA family ATPase [Virgibacillus sp. AGTR]|uniref:UvrD-helicase domain-containing protein n=1 Tax=Virgibacillus sp. AGTR TaxID=2812055 RepID=UPI001D166641|nr:UvrD-helicase domain-containing protein [Virgibacillus sp. AGTR]MCC2250283.1 AAA family ATPase [Virgibacillus sp. AGTR]